MHLDDIYFDEKMKQSMAALVHHDVDATSEGLMERALLYRGSNG